MKDAYKLIVATPFGIGCCNCTKNGKSPTPLENSRQLRHHIKKCWPDKDAMGININHLFDKKIADSLSISHSFGYSNYLLPGVVQRYVCTKCQETKSPIFWPRRDTALSHIRKATHLGLPSDVISVQGRLSTCGRFFTLDLLSSMERNNASKNQIVLHNRELKDSLGGITIKSFSSTITEITGYVQPDEKPEVYAEFLEPLLTGDGIEANIRAILKGMSGPSSTGTTSHLEQALLYLVKLSTDWIHDFARMEVDRVPGNIRASILNFSSGESVEGHNYHSTFNLRSSLDQLVDEMVPMIQLAWQWGYLSWARKEIEITGFSPNTNNFHLRQALIPRVLLSLLFDSSYNVMSNPFILSFVRGRAFHLTKENILKMYSSAVTSSRIASTLHLLQVGLCGVIARSGTCDNMIEANLNLAQKFRNCQVVNHLGPYIRRFRDMTESKSWKSIHFVDEKMNIIVEGIIFEFDNWRSIIPRTESYCELILSKIFHNNGWKTFLNASSVAVQNINGNFILEIDNEDVSSVIFWSAENDLKLQSQFCEKDLHKLISAIELAFHGFGGGSCRHTEITQVLSSDITISNGNIYYTVEVLKRARATKQHQKIIDHKLPTRIGRIALLCKFAIQTFFEETSPTENPYFFPSFLNNRMYTIADFVKEIFFLKKKPGLLQIRHLWASIANICFPKSKYNTSGITTAGTEASESFGHSTTTHLQHYSSKGIDSQEQFYRRWHECLGCHSTENVGNQESLVSDDCLYSTLLQLCGNDSKWRSLTQQAMVSFHATNTFQNAMISLPCGYGKSMSWLIPSLTRIRFGLEEYRFLVVLPTKFLASHLHYQAICKYGLYSHRIGVVFGSDVSEHGHKWFSAETTIETPSLIFCTINAVDKIYNIQGNPAFASFHRIFLDECHTILQEYGFRRCYEVVPKLSKMKNIPITMLSGTLPPSVASSLAFGTGISDSFHDSKICQFREGDPVGNNFSFFVTKTNFSPINNAINCGKRLLILYPTMAVHIICDTISTAKEISNSLLKSKFSCLLVTGETPLDEQNESSKLWYSSQTSFLVTTTTSLLGNENDQCCHIIVVGIIYSVANLIQSIGRLWPN